MGGVCVQINLKFTKSLGTKDFYNQRNKMVFTYNKPYGVFECVSCKTQAVTLPEPIY